MVGSTWQAAEGFLDLDYFTSFGDTSSSGSGTWRFGAHADAQIPRSKNTDNGPVVTHVYEVAGSYTVTTTAVAPNGSTSAVETQISITDPNTVWSGANTVCLSTNTDHTGCSFAAAVHVNNVTDLDTALTANGCHNASKRCLLHRGQTFALNPQVAYSGTSPRLLGVYGTGNKPVVNCVGNCFTLAAGNSDVRMVDIDFRGSGVDSTNSLWTASSGSAATAGSAADTHQMLCLRCDARHFNSVVFLHPNAPSNTLPDGVHSDVSIVDSDFRYSSGQGGPMLFMAGRHMTVLGSRVGDMLLGAAGLPQSTTSNARGEHTIRMKYCHECVFAHSSFGLFDDTDPGGVPGATVVGCDYAPNWVQGGLVLTLRDGFAEAYEGWNLPVSQARSKYEVIQDVLISSCRYTAWDLSIGATDGGAEKAAEGHEYVLVDGLHLRADYNDQTGQAGTGSAAFINLHNIRHAVVRNVTMDATDRASSQTGIALRIWSAQTGAANYLGVDDVRIQNTSFVQATSTTSSRTAVSLLCAGGQCPTNVNVDGLALYDGDGQASLLSASTAAVGCCGGSCPGTCNRVVTSNPFTGAFTGSSRFVDFTPLSATPLVGALTCGTTARKDALRKCRPASSCDAGAIELGGAVCE